MNSLSSHSPHPSVRTGLFPALILALVSASVLAWGEASVNLQNGLPWTVLSVFTWWFNRALVGAFVFLGLWSVLFRWIQRFNPDPKLGSLVVTTAAFLPFAAFWAYSFFLTQNIYVSQLFSTRSLSASLGFLLKLTLTCLALAFVTDRWRRRSAAGGRRMGRVSLILLLLIATGLNLTIAMVRSRPTQDQPNVIMIVVDALRPDHLGTYGYPRNTSPHIDEIASAGIRFDLAISQSTLTKTSIASLFTGLYPYRHGVYSGNRLTEDGRPVSDTLNSSHTTLAERLRSEGYLTAAWLQQSQLKSNSGYSRGFMFYRENSRDIRSIHRRFQRWLSRVRSTAPLFVYLHYIDLHDPYLPNPPFDTLFGEGGTIYQKLDLHHWKASLRDVRTGKLELTRKDIDQLEALYDGQISFIDQEIGKLWSALERQGILRNSVVILTSDHGDAFMEHGFISHSVQPYDELIKVPLIMTLPEEVAELPGSVSSQVRLIDVMPTILDLAGADAPADLDGRSLGGLLVGETGQSADSSVPEPFAISEVEVQTGEGTEFFVSIRSREQKYLASFSDSPELYDLVNDPGEQVNLMPVDPERTEVYRHIVQRILEAREDLGAGQIPLDEQTIEQLKALGYLE